MTNDQQKQDIEKKASMAFSSYFENISEVFKAVGNLKWDDAVFHLNNMKTIMESVHDVLKPAFNILYNIADGFYNGFRLFMEDNTTEGREKSVEYFDKTSS